MLGRWQRQVGIETLLRRVAYALAHAVYLRVRVKVEVGAAALTLLCSLLVGAGQSWGGEGSGACFACIAQLALVGNGSVLGVVHWRGMLGYQWWCIGMATALSQQ